jgi:phosphatidylglycerophosphate synthase
VTAPIVEAVVMSGPEDAGRAVAGVPLVLRTILSLQRAGITRCTLVGARAPSDPRIRLALAPAAALPAFADDALRLLVGPGTIIDDTLVRDLQVRAQPGQVLELERDGARIRMAPGALLARNGGRTSPAAGTLLPAGTPPAELERTLLRALENPRDGYLDRLLHRRLSRPLTRLLLRTRLSPNAVTVLGVAIGIAGGLVLGLPGAAAALASVLLLVVSGVLDCSDGELARLRFAESSLGHWLDITGDTLVHASLLAGIALRLGHAGSMPAGRWLGLLGVGVVGAFAAITWSEQIEARRQRVDAWENRMLDGVLSPLTTRDWYVFPVAFALAGRLAWLVPAAAVGAQVFWLGIVVLIVRVLRRA